MSAKLETLSQNLQNAFGNKLKSLKVALGEVTIEVAATDYLDVMRALRSDATLKFEELIDLCGVDYSTYGDSVWQGKRFAAVTHLLSIANNWRLRVRVFAEDDQFPAVDSVTGVWTSANWFEREAFDLYGIAFIGHDDLRRILTDYGFIGHPFRKDFPISGNVEMRYDPDQARVIYQPVTIEPRENTPRIVREDTYGDAAHG
ncbi:MAG: NADH-quinone oxidoreductase subunit C [Azonexus sp.]|nr:NADH-quinone oxidoreductase subunit C [Betaproteobacteria bacterium]MBK8917425.1 NADH-quinone oxidoreductase subunit C [Betaproteobacteria bacterium]MBP6035974.1 NADH-quinone oxidoreductase subunit C [Azonexus sp.]MBP6906496.1 NADH-quinone oxidoreductase subunit C [Azonexus sp.]